MAAASVLAAAQQDSPNVAAPDAPSTSTSANAAAGSVPPLVALGDPISMVPPKYPKNALKQKIEGSVSLKLLVSEKGNVEDVSLINGNPQLADAAMDAVRKWKYAPYLVDGKPWAAAARLTIKFRIDASGKPDISAVYVSPTPLVGEGLTAGKVFTVRDGISPPRLIYSPNPNYTEEARRAKYEGVCVLSVIVGADGKIYNLHVARSLSYGLDDKAIEAVRQWRFEPSIKDGKPVAVAINVEVTFRLY